MIKNLTSMFECLSIATPNLCGYNTDLHSLLKQTSASKSHHLHGLLFHTHHNTLQSIPQGKSFISRLFFFPILPGFPNLIQKNKC